MVVRPSDGSVKWLGWAVDFGVPIWVTFTSPNSYAGQDRDQVILRWVPNLTQLNAARTPQNPGPPPQADVTIVPPTDTTLLPLPPTNRLP